MIHEESNIKGELVPSIGDCFHVKSLDLAKLEDVVVDLHGFIDYWQPRRDRSIYRLTQTSFTILEAVGMRHHNCFLYVLWLIA